MKTIDVLWYAWPWIGIGGGIVIILLLFFSDTFRSNMSKSRWSDMTWLSWAMVAAYLVHVCEEYALHVADGQYQLITSFEEMGLSEMFGKISLGIFPYVNIMITWVAFPIAAIISKKNPVVGLSPMGFCLVNGITHLVGMIRMGISANYGAITGILLFIPLFIWICYVQRKAQMLSKNGLQIAILSGVIGHIALFSIYIFNRLIGAFFTWFYIPVVAFVPLIVSWLLCKVIHVNISSQNEPGVE